MDIEKIEKLIDIVIDKKITELEIHEDEKSWVRIGNKPQTNAVTSNFIPQPTTILAKETSQLQEQEKQYTINSPMVGTVYLSPTPGTKHFIEVGQQVKIGDTLCLIEAMKMFNSIEAEKAGVIKSCLIENEQPVEYGQPLFEIE